jgi:hypothetical protein
MPVPPKPLFRPEALRPKQSAFALLPSTAAARDKLANWAQLLGTDKLATKETELLPDFISELFGSLLGYVGPASGADLWQPRTCGPGERR